MNQPNSEPIEEWLKEVQRIIREHHADVYGSKYAAGKESWGEYHIEGLTPAAAVKEDLSNI
jgi:hypothetical protein